MDKTKLKPKTILHNDCFRFFVFALASPFLCFTSFWLFAHLGGEWAGTSVLPVPPNSNLLSVSYEACFQSSAYACRTDIYSHFSTLEELREWFIHSGIPFTPIALDIEGTSFIDNENYYYQGPLFHRSNALLDFHFIASMVTHGWYQEMMPNCQSIRLYKSTTAALNEYPELELSSNLVVFSITNCWPDVN
jgi:hypothetical protein